MVQQRRFKEAKELLADLLRLDSGNTLFLGLLAEIHNREDQPDKAEAVLNSAIGLKPDNAYLRFTKARLIVQLDRYQEAENLFMEVYRIDRQDAKYFAFWSYLKMLQKKYYEALQKAEQALALDAENIFALNQRNSLLSS